MMGQTRGETLLLVVNSPAEKGHSRLGQHLFFLSRVLAVRLEIVGRAKTVANT